MIQPGDTLKIEKQIFEVHLDGNLWEPGEFAEIAQYPTIPEPSSFLLAATVLGFIVGGRRKRLYPSGEFYQKPLGDPGGFCSSP